MLKKKAPQLFILFCFIFIFNKIICVIYSILLLLLICKKRLNYRLKQTILYNLYTYVINFTKKKNLPLHMSSPNLQANNFYIDFPLIGENIFFTLFARALHSGYLFFPIYIPPTLLYRSYLYTKFAFSM